MTPIPPNHDVDFTIDPELRDLLPRLTPPEREMLKSQIRRDGRVINPLVVWAEQKILVDGHHRNELVQELRQEGCMMAPPQVLYKPFSDRYAVVRWMIQHQNARRNWTPAEKAAAVLRNRVLIERLKEEARQRQRRGKRADLPTHGSGGDTRRFLARLAGVGEGTISRVQRVLESGNEEIVRKLLVERKLSAREAKRMAIREEERKRLSTQARSIAKAVQNGVFTTTTDDKLIHADVLDGLATIPSGSVALAFTSPPYPIKTVVYDGYRYDGNYAGYTAWLAQVWREVARTLRPGGRLVINIDSVADEFDKPDGDIVRPLYADMILAARAAGLFFMGDICWFKRHVTGRRPYWGIYGSCRSPRLRRNHEYLLVFFRETPVLEGSASLCDLTPEEFQKWTVGHWYIPPEMRKAVKHPAPFPELLAERVVRLFSYVGDKVLDPFCGSGTVPVVAKRFGRNFIGIDNSANYLDIARHRLEATRPTVPVSAT